MHNRQAVAKIQCGMNIVPCKASCREVGLDSTETLNRFLGDIERHSFMMAQIATGNREESLDIVHDAMFGFLKGIAGGPKGNGNLFTTGSSTVVYVTGSAGPWSETV